MKLRLSSSFLIFFTLSFFTYFLAYFMYSRFLYLISQLSNHYTLYNPFQKKNYTEKLYSYPSIFFFLFLNN